VQAARKRTGRTKSLKKNLVKVYSWNGSERVAENSSIWMRLFVVAVVAMIHSAVIALKG